METPEKKMFFGWLVMQYSYLTFPDKYRKLCGTAEPISWYLDTRDEENNFKRRLVYASSNENYRLINADISGAYPAICNNLFDSSSEFIRKLNGFSDKLEKNRFISDCGKNDLHMREYLSYFTKISKMIIMGTLFETTFDDEEITLLEMEKDGVLVLCSEPTLRRLLNLHEYGGPFSKMLKVKGFDIKVKEYEKYVRENRQSFYFNSESSEILFTKGRGKEKKGNCYPQKLMEALKDLLLENNLESQKSQQILQQLSEVYSDWNSVKMNRKTADDYYIRLDTSYNGTFGRVMNSHGTFKLYHTYNGNIIEKHDTEACGQQYMKIFINPIITAIKNNWEGGL